MLIWIPIQHENPPMSPKLRLFGYFGGTKNGTSNARNEKRQTYSWPSLVVLYSEEPFSRPFLGENSFRLVLQKRMSTENAVGCLFFSLTLTFVLSFRSLLCSRQLFKRISSKTAKMDFSPVEFCISFVFLVTELIRAISDLSSFVICPTWILILNNFFRQ